jgi:GNAT superfamily N-acetyltransferase
VRTKNRVRKLGNLTDQQYKACLKTNLGERGKMRQTFQRLHYRHPNDAWAFMVWSEDDTELLGWALVFPSEFDTHYDPRWEGKLPYTAYLYVTPKYRRKGIGRRIMRRIIRHLGVPRVIRWNTTSAAFYDNCDTLTNVIR